MFRRLFGITVLAAGLATGAPRTASAFCGFYVGGGDAKLYNNATLVVLMRDGTRTVLSMQNNYQGPPANFAMVVPVPVVLQKDDVKTLPRDVFDRVDQLAAPRLVEYWEVDPCYVEPKYDESRVYRSGGLPPPTEMPSDAADDLGVKIEAQFTVGEYEVVILSAQDSTGLDTWLRQSKYTIPEGAEPVLRPYVQAGMKFFVAKVDAKKVTFDAKGQAMLSPLRFHYDSEQFSLPVRLGLINSAGDQDLLVHILAAKRYEVANYPNAFIPTNLEVKDSVRDEFGKFYVSLFDAVLKQTPKAVVTEYSWQANNCDPCPQTPLQAPELVTLGADALPKYQQRLQQKDGSIEWSMPGEFVLTRLHARYSKDALGEDLVFREASEVVGGREEGEAFKLPQGATPSGVNNFQARYIIRHEWPGKIACQNPIRGRWGGPWPDWHGGGSQSPRAAKGLAFADRTGNLGMYVAREVPALAVVPASADPAKTEPAQTEQAVEAKADARPAEAKKPGGCACDTGAGAGAGGLLALGLLGLRRRRR